MERNQFALDVCDLSMPNVYQKMQGNTVHCRDNTAIPHMFATPTFLGNGSMYACSETCFYTTC